MSCSTCEIKGMNSQLNIRPFKDEDAEAVLTIRKKNLLQADPKDYLEQIIRQMIDKLTCESLIEISREPLRVVLVAESDSKVVGSVSLYDSDVRLMFVDPEFQHKGIGSELLNRIQEIAREKGIAKLSLKSSLPSQKFYEQHGFIKYGAETKDMGPVILMSKELAT